MTDLNVCKEETNTIMANQGEMKAKEAGLPPEIKDWTKDHVRKWARKLDGVDDEAADILHKQNINGPSLLLLVRTDLTEMGVTFGPAKCIIHSRDEMMKLKKEEPNSLLNQPGRPCKPYPFCRYHDAYRYMEGSILDIPESGALDLIEPCHEYKAFTNTTDETKMSKFTSDIICFAAACMNSRTNGTIHFGIGDKQQKFVHGQVLGVVAGDREAFGNELKSAIDKYFEYKQKETAQVCIKPPRFVGVLNKNMTSSDKCVIEVDVVSDSEICRESYHVYTVPTNAKKKKGKGKAMGKPETEPRKRFFIRDGGSSRDLLAPTTSAKPMVEYNKFVERMVELSQLRKQAEEKHLSVIKSSTQGSRLSQMITGGTHSLDKSHFECYVIVTNKSDSSQFESLGFLEELNPTAVLDFDPESGQHGLQSHFDQKSAVNPHLPAQYKITEGVEDIANKLKLTRNTSWVFCNGGIKDVPPSNMDQWLMEKGADTRDVISFLCRRDVLPNKRFLVTFLLLSTVSEKMDPLVETFSTFFQELKGTDQILCICDNERTFTSWRDLIDARCGIDITPTCIYELSFAEVNGTILSLLSKNRRSIRFLPCGGGSQVPLEKKVEQSMNTLEILCVNQCEGGNEDRVAIEENFYKGGKVEWWNFYFAEHPGSLPFIKRDKFDFILNTVLPDVCSQRRVCGLLHLKHVPGCGGTTLAMHVLWTLREKYRCAVLKDSNADLAEVTDEVIKLLMYPQEEKSPQIPVLLMTDDFDDEEKVFNLQQLIEEECEGKKIQAKSPQVIILNCMRSESHKVTESGDTVFLRNDLSDEEQKLFDKKLVEMKKTHKDVKTFYGFMILKDACHERYIQDVASNTLKGFDMSQKKAQLLAVLVLLDVYCRGAALSVSLCEEFLGLQTKPVCGTIEVKDGFGKFSTLISTCLTTYKVRFRAVKIIHTSIARHCLQDLEATHKVSKADIINFVLITDQLYESTQGKDKLQQNVLHILIRRYFSSAARSPFSPLITAIEHKTPEAVETVLNNASKRFGKDAFVCQLLARYYYLRKQNFPQAKNWAVKARDLSKNSSYFADTLAQVIKHELKNGIPKNKEVSIDPEELKTSLKLAQKAIDAFKEVQRLAKKESLRRLQFKTDNSPFNTSGCLGEIQVGVLTIEILQKTPVFSSSDPVRHEILSQVLSGKMLLQNVERQDKKQQLKPYYSVLREFEDMLSKLRSVMKDNFDFFESFYGNLGSVSGLKNSREQDIQNVLFDCFKVYGELFCQTDSAALLKSQTRNMALVKARQFLEKHKADTYSGILNLLNNISPEDMEQIVKKYRFIGQYGELTVKDKINFLYVNIVLSRIKPESQYVWPYPRLIYLLCQVLSEPVSFSDYMPLLFIAVLVLWPHHQHTQESTSVGTYISQMRDCYHKLFKEVYNGKRPIIHFFLGKKQGYKRLVHLEDVNKCIKNTDGDLTSLWRSGKIWKMEMVQKLLCRVTGEVDRNLILADTCIPSVRFEVTPMFQGQLSGSAQGSKVSFFLGFSMKGPIALDINLSVD